MSGYYGPPGGVGNASTPIGNTNATPGVRNSTYSTQQQQNPRQNNNASNFRTFNKSYNNDHAKIFVGGLSWQTTEESLRFHFEQFGPVASVDVMKDRNTGDPRGFAFVVFQDPSTIDLVMNEGRHEINHKIVDVKRAQARGQAPPSIHGSDGNANNSNNNSQQETPQLTPEQLHNKVFVGGIPPNIDKDGLKEIFEEFGPVVDAIVMVDQVTNRSRCFGFVTFENGSHGAQKAIAQQPLQIQGRHVEVKLATPKAEQRKMMPSSAGPKHVGLRAGMSAKGGKYAGFAVAFGRSGWKAGYGTFAFGQAGWGVQGWEDLGGIKVPERAGFSFSMLEELPTNQGNSKDALQHKDDNYGASHQPPSKRPRH